MTPARSPGTPRRWLVSGGGRHNGTLMTVLAARLDAPVAPVEAVGWNGDFIEAEAFAFLAMRSLRSLPLSLPATTGVPEPLGGGRFFPRRRARVRTQLVHRIMKFSGPRIESGGSGVTIYSRETTE